MGEEEDEQGVKAFQKTIGAALVIENELRLREACQQVYPPKAISYVKMTVGKMTCSGIHSIYTSPLSTFYTTCVQCRWLDPGLYHAV